VIPIDREQMSERNPNALTLASPRPPSGSFNIRLERSRIDFQIYPFRRSPPVASRDDREAELGRVPRPNAAGSLRARGIAK